ncbi:hypothetical protein CDAR_29881 [Caerostris darwini]|uniref:Uncharacterized protein n=1 Tax=Caerostris darwini TaxID=1538125 RepID=A0AAV4QUS9_9ARAC|nr:hypothetical protein CDAR_29881 [Caerostris darwini]
MGIIIGAEIDLRNVYVTHGDVPLARDIHVRRRYTPTPMGIHQFHKHTGNVNRLPEILGSRPLMEGAYSPTKGPAHNENIISQHSLRVATHRLMEH